MFQRSSVIFFVWLFLRNADSTGKKYVLQRSVKHDKLDLVASGDGECSLKTEQNHIQSQRQFKLTKRQ